MIIAITGGTGFIYGQRLLDALHNEGIESNLIMSKSAELTRKIESNISKKDLMRLASFSYAHKDIQAPIASGSYLTTGMIIAPCSMNSLAEIATGVSQNLIARAADVTLKERRRLVLLTRETPLNLIHLENMKKVTEMGAIIAPPVPAFYNKPESIDDLINHTVGRVLDLFDIKADFVKRWVGSNLS